jgi:glycosyltransferase involved in cell wall biosynthesis
MPLVSICIPVYKQTQYLKNCIESVLKQDFNDYELIFTDDTPDDTVEVFIKNLLPHKTYYYHRNNPSLGSPKNWNAAINKAKGKYIKLLHHDDFFTQPNSLSLMVEKIEAEKGEFLFCSTDVWHLKTNEHRIFRASKKQTQILKKNPDFLFFKNIIGAPSTTIHINKGLNYNQEFIWLVDVEFYIRLLKKTSTIINLSIPLVSTSHEGEGQLTGTVQNDREIQIREHVLLFNIIKTQKPKMYFYFFDYLFHYHNISSFEELLKIVPEASINETFFKSVLTQLSKNRRFKYFKKRFYESRYNNYFFKLEQFV